MGSRYLGWVVGDTVLTDHVSQVVDLSLKELALLWLQLQLC